MDFGYFTLSDNHYENNTRSANQFVADIIDEALYADKLGMHSAWIGEHHFNSLGVLSCPDLVLAYVAAQHQAHPPGAGGHRAAAAPSDPRRRAMGDARSAVRRPRRFRRRARLRPARISAVRRLVRRQSGDLRRRHRGGAPAVGGRRPHLASRQALFVRRRAHHAAAGAAADPGLCRLVLQAVDRAGGAARLRPDRGAVRRRHELRRAPAGRRSLSRDLRQARHQARPADVQLFHPFRRQRRRRTPRARARSATTRNASSRPCPAIRRPRRRATAISSTWSSG